MATRAILASLACACALSTAPASATSRVCADRGEILKNLERTHDETPTAHGLSADGAVVELLVSPDGSWTMLVTYAGKPTCVLAVGTNFEMLPVMIGQLS